MFYGVTRMFFCIYTHYFTRRKLWVGISSHEKQNIGSVHTILKSTLTYKLSCYISNIIIDLILRKILSKTFLLSHNPKSRLAVISTHPLHEECSLYPVFAWISDTWYHISITNYEHCVWPTPDIATFEADQQRRSDFL